MKSSAYPVIPRSIFSPFLKVFHLLRELLISLGDLPISVVRIDAAPAQGALGCTYGMWDLCIEHTDILEEAFEKTGIIIHFNDAVGRIEESTT
jgi:hypothetical protein